MKRAIDRLNSPIAVAMSGGLDSSVAASILASSEREVFGLSMLLWDEIKTPKHGRCCGSLDLGDARTVAEQVGIAHYTLRMDEEFRERVVLPFVGDYVAGKTPSPCVRCNTWVKFDLLVERARELGAAKVATGHYARLKLGDDGWELHQAKDLGKDQSYFLFELSQAQLEAALFPLGELTKAQVREHARALQLVTAEKGESMEVCFVADDIKSFIEQQVAFDRDRFDALPDEGAEVVDEAGRKLGQSDPFYRYTVGQRRGLGIASDRRLHVLDVDAESNRLVVGPKESLLEGGLHGSRCHWIGTVPSEPIEATVRIRSRHAGVRALIRQRADAAVEIEFAEPQWGVTPGQAAVFYDRSQVLGGCWIEGASGTAQKTRAEPSARRAFA